MITIKAKANQYSKNGSIIFVYSIMSNLTDKKKAEAELKDYEETQGAYLRKDEAGDMLYFSQRICTTGSELTKTTKGRYTVLQDLEQKAAELESATTTGLGKLNAIQQFCGMSRAQMTERLMASF
jgi:uridine phosphorylase